MESSRFGEHNKLFIFGMICLATSLGLFIFCLYILPYFIWELGYNIPDFILNLLAKYQEDYHYSSAASKTIVWFLFFIPCIITGIISYFISRYFDKQVSDEPTTTAEEKSNAELKKQMRESVSLGGKILGLMMIIIMLILLLQYFIESTVSS
jgi:ATP/ADP translocase